MAITDCVSKKRSETQKIAMIPHTTYLGHSQCLGAAVFLERKMPPRILFRFDDCKPQIIQWQQYDELINELKKFQEMVETAEQARADYPVTSRISGEVMAIYLESRRINLRWQQHNLLLSPEEFAQVMQVLVATHIKAKPQVRRMLEKAALLQQYGLLANMARWGGLLAFSILTGLDILLLLSMMFQPALYWPWTILTTFLASWLLFVRPEWSHKVLPMLLEYLNDQLLADLANLRLPRKSIEFFLIIFMGVIYMLCFGSEAANYIFDFYKSMYVP